MSLNTIVQFIFGGAIITIKNNTVFYNIRKSKTLVIVFYAINHKINISKKR